MPNWRILVVDDDQDIRSILRVALSSKYEVVEAQDGLSALAKLELAEPDFVILDVMMPFMDGFETCRNIRRSPRFKDVSVLFLTALDSREHIKSGYSAGGSLYLTKPIDPLRLLRNVDVFFETHPMSFSPKHYSLEELRQLEEQGPAALAGAQSAAAAPPMVQTPSTDASQAPLPRVLLVDDDPDVLDLARLSLGQNYEVITAGDGLEALSKIASCQPDMLVMDVMMPKMSGYQLCQTLRRNSRYRQTPVLFVSAKSSPRERDYALRVGGSDFLAKPFDPRELIQKVEGLKEQPGYAVHPKSLSLEEVQVMHSRKKQGLEERQDRLLRKEESELEKFLRENA